MLKAHGWSPSLCIPQGDHQMSLNIAAGLGIRSNESYPDLFQSYDVFPDGVRVDDGNILMPEIPGIDIDIEGKSDPLREMCALSA